MNFGCMVVYIVCPNAWQPSFAKNGFASSYIYLRGRLDVLFQNMKNVRCKKLVIDRNKAPGKVGTFKDISLFGNFTFSSNGGMAAQSLAGIGKAAKKTKAQAQAIAMRSEPIAGASGATTSDDMLRQSDERVDGQLEDGDTYSVKFIQLASEPSTPTANDNPAPTANANTLSNQVRPSAGFAIKKGGAKRVTFTQEQKDIMASFYEKQRSSSIRANPAEVIEAMKAAGVPPLKESQIKSWWSTYHRKQKQIAEDLVEEARQLRSQHEGKTSKVTFLNIFIL